MPTSQERLWAELGRRLGWQVPEQARAFLRCVGLVGQRDESQVLQRAEQILRCMRASGLLAERESLETKDDPPTPTGQRDERWALWRDLRRRASDPKEDWRAFRLALVVDASNPALPSKRVEISFDSRLSQGALVHEIRRLWPRLKGAHWMRETKALEPRAEALLRFVCLEEQPDTPWREMMEGWNRKYPEWRHKDVRDFRSRFSRHEEQLTGHKYGLEWFYTVAARAAWESLADMDIGDLERAEEQGGTPETRAIGRLLSPKLAWWAYGRVDPELTQVRVDEGKEGENDG